jgi:hypothetical protein
MTLELSRPFLTLSYEPLNIQYQSLNIWVILQWQRARGCLAWRSGIIQACVVGAGLTKAGAELAGRSFSIASGLLLSCLI